MGTACAMDEGEERCIEGFGGKTLSKMITCWHGWEVILK
jgi:hypothetical protein